MQKTNKAPAWGLLCSWRPQAPSRWGEGAERLLERAKLVNLQRSAPACGPAWSEGLAPTVSSLIPKDRPLPSPPTMPRNQPSSWVGVLILKSSGTSGVFYSPFPALLEFPKAKGQLRITGQWTAMVSARTQKPHRSVRGPWACGKVETTAPSGLF